MVAAASAVAGSALIATLVSFVAIEFWSCTSLYYLHEVGLCCHDCISPSVLVCGGRASEGPDISLVCDCIHRLPKAYKPIWAKELLLQSVVHPRVLEALPTPNYLPTCTSLVFLSIAFWVWCEMTFSKACYTTVCVPLFALMVAKLIISKTLSSKMSRIVANTFELSAWPHHESPHRTQLRWTHFPPM